MATGCLNVATGSISRSCLIIVKRSTKLLFCGIFLYIAATLQTLSPQKYIAYHTYLRQKPCKGVSSHKDGEGLHEIGFDVRM